MAARSNTAEHNHHLSNIGCHGARRKWISTFSRDTPRDVAADPFKLRIATQAVSFDDAVAKGESALGRLKILQARDKR